MRSGKHGFSIVEVIIVIAVIGVLAAILIPVLSKVIKDSQTASALSDARNTLTDMKVAQLTSSNSIIAVEKDDRVYVYGWFGEQNELIEGRFNPYINKNNQLLSDFLYDNGCFLQGTVPSDITDSLDSPLSSVTVFGNTSLASVSESVDIIEGNVGMAVGERHTLEYTVAPFYVSPLFPVIFESSDPTVVKIDGNDIIALKEGKVTITARFGASTDTCDVTVCAWYEYGGYSLAELKSMIENPDEDVLLVKLTVDFGDYGYVYAENNPDIFPIVIPKGKVVRLDLNARDITYYFDSQSNLNPRFFINDGGYFTIESYSYYESGSIGRMYTGNSDDDIETIDGTTIMNINGGTFSLFGECTRISSAFVNTTIQNGSGSKCLIQSGEDIYDENHVSGYYSVDAFVLNDPGATLVVRESNVGRIVNYGIISEIYKSEVSCGLFKIKNYGIIESIVDSNLEYGILALDNELGATEQAAILNSGKNAVIRNIVNSWMAPVEQYHPFLDEYFSDVPDDGGCNYTGILCKDGAKIEKITSGTFAGKESSIIFDSSNAKGIIYGGRYFNELPEKYIADGYECVKKNERWFEVVPKQ